MSMRAPAAELRAVCEGGREGGREGERGRERDASMP